MTSRLLISLSLLLAGMNAGAQLLPAEDFFNGGAQLYISNNIPAALEKVELGRKTYPADEKLKKLEELLKQKQQQQQQQQQQQNQQNQQQSQKDQQKKPDEPKQPEPKNQSDDKKDESPKPPEQKKAAGDPAKNEKPEPPSGSPAAAQPMSPDEAKHLLDAQKDAEQFLQMKPENKPRDNRRPVKDW